MNKKGEFTSIDDAKGRCALGGKILGLADLFLAGFPIPENTYFLESISSLSKGEFCHAVDKLNPNYPIILRSSASVEDGAAHSFAGLFHSVVCHNIDDVGNGFDTVKSYNRENIAFAYPEFQKDHIELNCILQSYIHYEFAGVFITRYRDSEDGYCECVEGDSLAQILHHGECDYSFFIRDGKIQGSPPNKDTILFNYNLVFKAFQDSPYQYEWCISKGKFYFLQKRPFISIQSKQENRGI